MSWPDPSALCSEIYTWYKESELCTPENEERIFLWLVSNEQKNQNDFLKWLKGEGASTQFARRVWECLLEHKRLSDMFVVNKTQALVEADLLDSNEAGDYLTLTKASIRW